jgi:hypothetical protein
MVSLQDPAGRDMPDARRPGRPLASPGEPDGRQSLVYALKDQTVRRNGWDPHFTAGLCLFNASRAARCGAEAREPAAC